MPSYSWMSVTQLASLVAMEGRYLDLFLYCLSSIYQIKRGTEDYFEMIGAVDIINSTLGKALGGAAGGYTTARQPVIDLLRQISRPYLFSNSLPPAVVGQASQVGRQNRSHSHDFDTYFKEGTVLVCIGLQYAVR